MPDFSERYIYGITARVHLSCIVIAREQTVINHTHMDNNARYVEVLLAVVNYIKHAYKVCLLHVVLYAREASKCNV